MNIQRVKSLADHWDFLARKQFKAAEEADSETGRRMMEYGATIPSIRDKTAIFSS